MPYLLPFVSLFLQVCSVHCRNCLTIKETKNKNASSRIRIPSLKSLSSLVDQCNLDRLVCETVIFDIIEPPSFPKYSMYAKRFGAQFVTGGSSSFVPFGRSGCVTRSNIILVCVCVKWRLFGDTAAGGAQRRS